MSTGRTASVLAALNVFDVGDLTAAQAGSSTEVSLTAGGSDLITLTNPKASDIDATDFVFV